MKHRQHKQVKQGLAGFGISAEVSVKGTECGEEARGARCFVDCCGLTEVLR